MTNLIYVHPVYEDGEDGEDVVSVEEEDNDITGAVSTLGRIICFGNCFTFSIVSIEEEKEVKEVDEQQKENPNSDEKKEVDEQQKENPNSDEKKEVKEVDEQQKENPNSDEEKEVKEVDEQKENIIFDVQVIQDLVWPSWFSSIADAIGGQLPRSLNSFEILNKIWEGNRREVFKARDILTGKIVALKKIHLQNLVPEDEFGWKSTDIEIVTNEIQILRRLGHHPNVIKLEGLVLNHEEPLCLYQIFEYMENDLAHLTSTHRIKFTEPQVKCYMRQLLLGLEHCHERGVWHRNIDGSNLLIGNGGILKIGGFGSAASLSPLCCIEPPVTYYQPPECSFRSTATDLWSSGCILAELLSTKPIPPRYKRVERARFFRKLFKDIKPSSLPLLETLLAKSPDKRPSASAALRSEFFEVRPYACEPLSMPQYPPRKPIEDTDTDIALSDPPEPIDRDRKFPIRLEDYII